MTFPMGRIVATRGLLAHLKSINATALPYLARHQKRDWGHLSRSDKAANERALVEGGRLLSKYMLKDGTDIYVITEWDRSYTTLMLCTEY